MVNGGRGTEVFFEPVSKSSASVFHVLNWTLDGWAFVLVNDPLFCSLVFLSLGAMSRLFVYLV